MLDKKVNFFFNNEAQVILPRAFYFLWKSLIIQIRTVGSEAGHQLIEL